MNKNRFVIIIILLASTLILIHVTPKATYVGTDFISQLEVPLLFADWAAKDVSDQIAVQLEEHPDKFANDVIAHQYNRDQQQSLLFLILDAGNFHHPNVCFTMAGYEIKELQDTEFTVANRSFRAHTLLTKKNNESFLSIYWISINKKVIHEWVEQKVKQLYFSLLNKKRVGLMIRIDVPMKENDIDSAIEIARNFVNDLSKVIKPHRSEYIFGQGKPL